MCVLRLARLDLALSTRSFIICLAALQQVGKTEKEREACQLEIKLLERLEHPGVVEYVESFQIPKSTTLCIVMAFCEGGDLTNYLKKRRNVKLSEKEILDFFIQMVLALHFMHERNIMHRDLKTQNVFLKNGALKLGGSFQTELHFLRSAMSLPFIPVYLALF